MFGKKSPGHVAASDRAEEDRADAPDEDATLIDPTCSADDDATLIDPTGAPDPDATLIDPTGSVDADATLIDPVGNGDPDSTLIDPGSAVDSDATMVDPTSGSESAAAAPGLDPGSPTHPDWIGHFKVVGTLGEGGMGAVYLAEQTEPVARKVALKVIHASLRSHDAMVRFEAERQAMARLSHPNVAALFEAGATPDGFPYFAMEQVQGEELGRYCDQQKMTIDERLKLFIEVCAGVHHAHQKGILHRDLKPSNVLVADVGGSRVPKIIDFGIAKAVDEPLTASAELTGQRAIGTPAYMSPEALAGSQDLDIRTDVYSLGVVLYELLLGSKPGAPLKAERKVRVEAGPTFAPSVRPLTRLAKGDSTQLALIARRRKQSVSELKSTIRGDLDWIVMKAIAEERDQRYDSVAELARDIERHLAFEPVLAGPPSVSYRVGRFVRRHRVGVAAGIVIFLTLIGGIVGTTLGLLRAQAAEAEARLEATRAERVAGFMTELFRVSDPGEARGNSITARELLDRGATRIDRELADQPILRARLMGTMGNVYSNLGLYEQAVDLAEGNLSVQESQLGPNHPEVAASLTRLGRLYRLQGRFDDSESLLRRAVAIYGDRGLDDPRALADTLVALATVRVYRGETAVAESTYREAIAVLEGAADTPVDQLAMARHHYGWFLGSQGRSDEAVEVLGETVALRQEALGNDHFEVAESMLLLAAIERDRGNFVRARELMEQGLAIQQRVLEPDHPDIGQTYLDLGGLMRFQGRGEEAATYLAKAEALFRTAFGPDHLELARVLQESGLNAADLGDWVHAWEQFSEQLDILMRSVGEEQELTGMALNNLGWVLSDGLERLDEGEQVLRRAVALFDRLDPRNSYWQGLTRWTLAANLGDQGRTDEAIETYEAAAAHLRDAGGADRADNPDLDQLVADYAVLLREAGRADEIPALEARLTQ